MISLKTTNRKNEHVSLSEKFYSEKSQSSFEDFSFVHHSFPAHNESDASLNTAIETLTFDSPFFINAMTGGSKWTEKVNGKLATVARETGLAMATGSISAALKDPEVANSYKIARKQNPNGLLFANLGAGHSIENAKRAIDLIQADALQIHINAPQELVMPEGDRDFSNWLENIAQIKQQAGVPIIAKEVGFGMSRETIQLLIQAGISIVDVSGTGGTNFAQIENYRRKVDKLDALESWGQSTPISLLEAQSSLDKISLISSGGIRSAGSVVKSLALGAKLVGVSSHFLHLILQEDEDAAISEIERWKKEIRKTMTLLSASRISELQETDMIIGGKTKEWCEARNIDYRQFANRFSLK
ncbi:type 2 isopentenyl-diphosphate Delta-isomerase [Lacticigenium naphthae]|uniref:type 2 isopentenyl-diphosphate Delta-isomerase n=1 Tax=Lacticigenium naphthae TaxID=515351 RepID=UPI00316AD24A